MNRIIKLVLYEGNKNGATERQHSFHWGTYIRIGARKGLSTQHIMTFMPRWSNDPSIKCTEVIKCTNPSLTHDVCARVESWTQTLSPSPVPQPQGLPATLLICEYQLLLQTWASISHTNGEHPYAVAAASPAANVVQRQKSVSEAAPGSSPDEPFSSPWSLQMSSEQSH